MSGLSRNGRKTVVAGVRYKTHPTLDSSERVSSRDFWSTLVCLLSRVSSLYMNNYVKCYGDYVGCRGWKCRRKLQATIRVSELEYTIQVNEGPNQFLTLSSPSSRRGSDVPRLPRVRSWVQSGAASGLVFSVDKRKEVGDQGVVSFVVGEEKGPSMFSLFVVSCF